MKPKEYLEHVRELVDRGEYEQAIAFAERETASLNGRLSRKQLASLGVLMEHANLAAALQSETTRDEETAARILPFTGSAE